MYGFVFVNLIINSTPLVNLIFYSILLGNLLINSTLLVNLIINSTLLVNLIINSTVVDLKLNSTLRLPSIHIRGVWNSINHLLMQH